MNKGIFFTASSALLYGSIGYFGVRLSEQNLSVPTISFWRFLFSCLLLLPFLPYILYKDNCLRHKKALFSLFMLGGVFHGLGVLSYFEASKSIGTGLAMVIFFTYPIFVVLLSFILKKAPVSRTTLVALSLIVIGCTLIAGGAHMNAHLDLSGMGLALLSGLSYGIYVFYSKELSAQLSPLLATSCVCLGTFCAFACYILFADQSFSVPAQGQTWLLLGLFAVIGTVMPVLLLLAGMNYLTASTASIISVLEPIVILGVGALVLGEALHSMQVIGAILILSATLVVYYKRDDAQALAIAHK